MIFQELAYHHTHFSSCTISFLPIYCTVLSQLIGKLLCNSNKLLILIEVLDRLRFCECIIESKLISSQTEIAEVFGGESTKDKQDKDNGDEKNRKPSN